MPLLSLFRILVLPSSRRLYGRVGTHESLWKESGFSPGWPMMIYNPKESFLLSGWFLKDQLLVCLVFLDGIEV